MDTLNGKIAVVTGGTSGIGAACCVRLAEEGALVVVTGRNEQRGVEIAQRICHDGGRAVFHGLDVEDDQSIAALAHDVREQYGRVDVLFNNAGAYPAFPKLGDIERQGVEQVFGVNAASMVMVTKYFLPLLEESRGTLINNASVAGIQTFASGQGYAYAASKAAVIQFTRMMAKVYAGKVRVNCICPGVIDTPLYFDLNREGFAQRIPAGRVGVPEDVANVVAFLASEAAGYIYGAVIPIDGGLTL